MRKDKNGTELVCGDMVSLAELTFEIKEFVVRMNGCVACGANGCFNVKELEKVVVPEGIEITKTTIK